MAQETWGNVCVMLADSLATAAAELAACRNLVGEVSSTPESANIKSEFTALAAAIKRAAESGDDPSSVSEAVQALLAKVRRPN